MRGVPTSTAASTDATAGLGRVDRGPSTGVSLRPGLLLSSQNMTTAAMTASVTSARCAPSLPSRGTASKPKTSVPIRAPTVLTAVTRPTTRPGSLRSAAAAARAKGTLTPQSTVAGNMATAQRSMLNTKRPVVAVANQVSSGACQWGICETIIVAPKGRAIARAS